jgi:hypothetical protein
MTPGSLAALQAHARELSGLGPTWLAYRWHCLMNGADLAAYQVTGAIAPLKTRGPGTGKPNWRKADTSSRRQVTLTVEAHHAWCASVAAASADVGRVLLAAGGTLGDPGRSQD